MPRLTIQQTNFTSGEMSPRVLGRTDIQRYPNGCKTLSNAMVLVQGGVKNAYGTRFIKATKYSAKKSRLLPFVYSVTQAYIVEIGDLYLRFFTNNAVIESSPSVAYEIVSPWTEAQLPDLDFVQRGDTMFVFHPSVVPYRIRRFADALWDCQPAPFSVLPFDEVGDSFATVVTLSATTGAITATAAAATWLQGDVGRTITYLGGSATITGYTSTTVVNATVVTPFSTVTLPSSSWRLGGSPQVTLTPGASTPIETSTTLTAVVNAFRTTDVGKYVKINSGLMLITAYTTALQVTATIKQVLTGVTAAPANAWSLNGAMWSASLGYPRCGVIHQQRLILAGSSAYP